MGGKGKMAAPAPPRVAYLCYVAFTLCLIGHKGCVGQSPDIVTVTNCTEKTLLPRANPENVTEIYVVLNNDTDTDGVNCSWVIPRPSEDDDHLGNTLAMFQDSTDLLCQHGDIRMYDSLPSSANQSCGISACSPKRRKNMDAFNGRPGSPTVVALSLRTVPPGNHSFLLYQSFAWTGTDCPEQYLTLNATAEEQSVKVGYDAMSDFLPSGLNCFWEFVSPDQGIVTITMSGWIARGNCTESPNYLWARDQRESAAPVSYNLCQNSFDYKHVSLSGSVFLELHTADTGDQSPTFTITYSAQSVCSSSMPLETRKGRLDVFKGAADPLNDSACSWNLTTDMSFNVVMVTKIDNTDFVQTDCSQEDYLSVGEGGGRISLCDNSSLPVWSQGRTMDLHLHSQHARSRRNFLVFFTEVGKVSACQGHSKTYKVVTGDWVNVESMDIQYHLAGIGASCRWTFLSSSHDRVLQVRVSIYEGESSARHDCSLWKDKFLVHESNRTATSDRDATLRTSCSLDLFTVQLVFTSPAKALTLEYPVGRSKPEPFIALAYRLSHNGAGMTAVSWSVVVLQLIWLRMCLH